SSNGFSELGNLIAGSGNPLTIIAGFCDQKYEELFATKAEELGLTEEEVDNILNYPLTDGNTNPFLSIFANEDVSNEYKYELLLALHAVLGDKPLSVENISTLSYDKVSEYLMDKMSGGQTAQEVLFGNEPISGTQAKVLSVILSGILNADNENYDLESLLKEAEDEKNSAELDLINDKIAKAVFLGLIGEEFTGIKNAISNAEAAGWQSYSMDVNHTIASWRTYDIDSSAYVEDGTYIVTITSDGRQSITTQEGGVVDRGNGTTYKIFGVQGDAVKITQYTSVYTDAKGNEKTFTADAGNVCWEFEIKENKDGVTYSIKLDGTNNLYILDNATQIEQYKSQYKANTTSGDSPLSQTRAVINENDTGYIASGAGSRVTMDLSKGKGKAESVIAGNGTVALTGSQLITETGGETVKFKVTNGSMTYSNGTWSTNANSIFQYVDNTMGQMILDYADTLIEGSWTKPQINLIGVNMTGTAGSMSDAVTSYNKNKNAIEYIAGENSSIISSDEAGKVFIPQGTRFELQVNENGNIGLVFAGNSSENEEETFTADVALTDTKHYSLADGATTIENVVFNEGDFVNFWTGLYNSQQTVVTNFAFSITDDKGTVTKINKGLSLTGSKEGESVLTENLSVNFTTDAGQKILKDGTATQAYWQKGSVINFSFGKNNTTSAVIEGNFTVKNALINDKTDSSSGGGSDFDATFNGTVYDQGSTLKVTGTFHNVASDTLVSEVSAQAVYAVGSKYDKGSIINGQILEQNCEMTSNGLAVVPALPVPDISLPTTLDSSQFETMLDLVFNNPVITSIINSFNIAADVSTLFASGLMDMAGSVGGYEYNYDSNIFTIEGYEFKQNADGSLTVDLTGMAVEGLENATYKSGTVIFTQNPDGTWKQTAVNDWSYDYKPTNNNIVDVNNDGYDDETGIRWGENVELNVSMGADGELAQKLISGSYQQKFAATESYDENGIKWTSESVIEVTVVEGEAVQKLISGSYQQKFAATESYDENGIKWTSE
ncbi:MAG: hypothetical protein PHN29_07655, partial [Endomicrobiaceae bacterium]|nr:hypothetical protein [Endomicrobiaceae bacterium]